MNAHHCDILRNAKPGIVVPDKSVISHEDIDWTASNIDHARTLLERVAGKNIGTAWSTSRHKTTSAAARLREVYCLSWIPIFSRTLVDDLLSAGLYPQELIKVDFGPWANAGFMAHVPTTLYEALDWGGSKFSAWLPGDPPTPWGLQNPVFTTGVPEKAGLFRVPLPGRPRETLSELFATHQLVSRLSKSSHKSLGIT